VTACLLCDHRDSGHRYACHRCVRDAQRKLRELETYAAMLPGLTTPGRGTPGRGTPGYGSRSPARNDVIVTLDLRSKPDGDGPDDEDNPPHSIPREVRRLACWLREEFDETHPRRWTVSTEIAYLMTQIDRSACNQWIVELAAEIRALWTQARALAHDLPPRPLGPCPNTTDAGECGAALFVPLYTDTVRCRSCRRTWARDEWLNLAMLLTNTNPRTTGL